MVGRRSLSDYLKKALGPGKLAGFRKIGKGVYGEAYGFSWGKKRLVLKTAGTGPFGHDHFSDIAHMFLWQNSAFNSLPRHVKARGVLAQADKELLPVGSARKFYILMERAEGEGYFSDLDAIAKRGELIPKDMERCLALSDYLAGIHAVKGGNPSLYIRKIRDTIGHGECIAGVLDGYPEKPGFTSRLEMAEILSKCSRFWAVSHENVKRLSQVHGDFHPGNILWKGKDFILLDRSRGEYGEPADDVTCLLMNYIFMSLVRYGRFTGPFEMLYNAFLDNYASKTGDKGLGAVAPLFLAFRSIVIANPVFYPDRWYVQRRSALSPDETRRRLFGFAKQVLDTERLDMKSIGIYLD